MFTSSRLINLIVIHCAATPNGGSLFRGRLGEPGFKTPIEVLDEMHRERGFHRQPDARAHFNPELTSIGYHLVIYTEGTVVTGRSLDEVGAHVAGHNENSIGVSMIGTDAFTPAQWDGLARVINDLHLAFPNARICGHRDLSPDLNHDGIIEPCEWIKICPGFDVASWLKDKVPEPKHVFSATA